MSLVECPETNPYNTRHRSFYKGIKHELEKAYTINGAGGRVKLDSYLSSIKIQSN